MPISTRSWKAIFDVGGEAFYRAISPSASRHLERGTQFYAAESRRLSISAAYGKADSEDGGTAEGDDWRMSPARRIFLNIVATYGRSLFALVCGLFSTRWVLQALGVEAYGVYGVVGVIVLLCTTINYTLSGSTGRFFAYSLGNKDADLARKDCNAWFNVALVSSFALPTVLAVLGLVFGSWAIDSYFNIPARFVSDAHWVLRLSVISMFVAMALSPFRAMYTAKQCIAELSLYELAVPLVTLVCSYLMLSYGGNRLLFYAWYNMLLNAGLAVLIAVRAMRVFDECRINLKVVKDRGRFRELFSFASWQFVGLTGLAVRNQGSTVVVNKMAGVEFNSTMSVATTVSVQVGTLSAALNNAFYPAITSAAGAGDFDRFYRLSFQTSKFGTLLMSVFALPMALEADYVIRLWLKNPPDMVVPVCIVMLVNAVLERIGQGSLIAVNASGNVKWHELLCFVIHVVTIALCVLLAWGFECRVVGVAVGLLIGTALLTAMRMALWKIQLSFPLRDWAIRFVLPFAASAALSTGIGMTPRCFMKEGFARLLLSSALSVAAQLATFAVVVLNREEREFVASRIRSFLQTRGSQR